MSCAGIQFVCPEINCCLKGRCGTSSECEEKLSAGVAIASAVYFVSWLVGVIGWLYFKKRGCFGKDQPDQAVQEYEYAPQPQGYVAPVPGHAYPQYAHQGPPPQAHYGVPMVMSPQR